MRRGTGSAIAWGVLCSLVCSDAPAAWIQTLGQSENCTNLGGACVAREGDLAASYTNPAAAAGFETFLFGFNGKLVDTRQLDLRDDAGNQDVSRTNGEGAIALSPSLGAYWPVGDRWNLGVGLGSPFAISGDWANDQGLHRYNMSEQALFLLDVTPTVAFQATDRLSLGVGLHIVAFKHLRLETLIPDSFGAALPPELGGAGVIIPTTPTSPIIGSITFNTDEDINIWLPPDDMTSVWDEFAVTLGAQYVLSDRWTIGAAWRSKTDSTWTGELTLDFTASGGGMERSPFSLEFDMPGHLQVGFVYAAIPERLSWSVDLQWTFWSDADGIGSPARFELSTPLLGFVDGIEVSYEGSDTLTARTGLEYILSDRWALQAGYAFDEAIFDDGRVDILTYDGDRHIVSFGARYRNSADWSFTAGLQAVLYEDRPIAEGVSANLGGVSLPNLVNPTTLGFVPNRGDFAFGGTIWTLGLGVQKGF